MPDLPGLDGKAESLAAQMTQNMKRQSEIDQKVLQDAGEFLSPTQIRILGTSQSNRISMQKMLMTMAQKMADGPASNAAPASR